MGSIPHEFLVVFDSVFFEERDVFVLECQRAVMLLLSLDIFVDVVEVGSAHAERAVSRLPREGGVVA